jgi:CRP/FNR family transcriptional regulator, cyclic AMP receptor protein
MEERIVPSKKGHSMKTTSAPKFSTGAFLATEGTGRKLTHLKPAGIFFSQGTESNSVFYLSSGRAKLTVVSKGGKEATITLLVVGDFIGEEAISGIGGLRMATASAITACSAMKISRDVMIRALHDEHVFSDFFVRFLLARGIRTQADLVDQLFNSSEKRLARTLLLMAEFGKPGEPETLIPEITQEALADLIGTTRSRVSFFMNRFRKLGFIDYNGRIRVHKSLLNVVLHDQFGGHNSERPRVNVSDHLRIVAEKKLVGSPRKTSPAKASSAKAPPAKKVPPAKKK